MKSPAAPNERIIQFEFNASMSMSSSKEPNEKDERSAGRGECAESSINRALLDPSRFGWTAGGAIADLLPPHLRARKSTRTPIVRRGRKRKRPDGRRIQRSFSGISGSPSVEPENDARSIESENIPLASTPQNSVEETDKHSTFQNEIPKNGFEASENYCRTENSISFKGLSDDGKLLDTHMYHRGRQGAELREEDTGMLLCDVEPTDTNHNLTEPKLKTNVFIEFSLADSGLPEDDIYKEVINWDLGDDSTPTPQQFAAEVAQNFGLTFAQMQQLAESIQNQLRAFVQENCSYAPSISLQGEAFFQEKPQCVVPCLYGEVTGEKRGGAWYSTQKPRGRKPSGILRPPQPIEKTVSRGRPPLKRKRESFSDGDGDIEDFSYQREIQRRLQAASESEIIQINSRRAENSSDNKETTSALGPILCHICDKEVEHNLLPCTADGHAMCSEHLKLFFPAVAESSYTIPHCPICALRCDCKSCIFALKSMSRQFRIEQDDQAVSMENTTFDDILSRRRSFAVRRDKRKGKRRSTIAVQRPSVPKVPPAEFPREVFNGADLDPGSDLIYATIYSKNGAIVDHDAESTRDNTVSLDDAIREGSEMVTEDGSVDYCNVCLAVGNLLCCDYCPRAFHRACIADDPLETVNALWECPSCRKEKAGLIEDLIDGSKHVEQVVTAFDRSTSNGSDDELVAFTTLSIIYEMILYLMEYDFGQIFRDPVNVDQFPSYRALVKNPMDLGTIAGTMINGIYFDRFKSSSSPLEDSLLAVLKDLELVWHNCFIFNREGSAVYRMAQVQKGRATSIRSKSFNHLMNERVKEELSRYEEMLEQERQVSTRISLSVRPPARHKIVATSSGSIGRPIAALDPDTGRVVKVYATMPTLSAVFDLFSHLNYPSEWERFELDTTLKIRKYIFMSAEDPKVRIYGYRWVFLDDLQKGKVAFEEDFSAQHLASVNSAREDNEGDKKVSGDFSAQDLASVNSAREDNEGDKKVSGDFSAQDLASVNSAREDNEGDKKVSGDFSAQDLASVNSAREDSEGDKKVSGDFTAQDLASVNSAREDNEGDKKVSGDFSGDMSAQDIPPANSAREAIEDDRKVPKDPSVQDLAFCNDACEEDEAVKNVPGDSSAQDGPGDVVREENEVFKNAPGDSSAQDIASVTSAFEDGEGDKKVTEAFSGQDTAPAIDTREDNEDDKKVSEDSSVQDIPSVNSVHEENEGNKKALLGQSESSSESHVFIEVCIDEHSYIFNALEQALAYANSDISTFASLDAELSLIVDDYVEFDGKKWKKIQAKIDHSLWTHDKLSTATLKGIELALLPDLAVLKEDTVSRQILVGFRTIDAAYCDWLRTISAFESNFDHAETKEDFCKHFLLGSEIIDGIQWKAVTASTNYLGVHSSNAPISPGCTSAQNGSKKFDLMSPKNAESDLVPLVE